MPGLCPQVRGDLNLLISRHKRRVQGMADAPQNNVSVVTVANGAG